MHIPGVLAAGIEVLVYAGDQDFICNVEGNRRWVDAMVWDGQLEFSKAPVTDWTLDSGPVAGQFRSAKGLTFLDVNGAGHMVPMDQPEAALEMLEIFTKVREEQTVGVVSAPCAPCIEAVRRLLLTRSLSLCARLALYVKHTDQGEQVQARGREGRREPRAAGPRRRGLRQDRRGEDGWVPGVGVRPPRGRFPERRAVSGAACVRRAVASVEGSGGDRETNPNGSAGSWRLPPGPRRRRSSSAAADAPAPIMTRLCVGLPPPPLVRICC